MDLGFGVWVWVAMVVYVSVVMVDWAWICGFGLGLNLLVGTLLLAKLFGFDLIFFFFFFPAKSVLQWEMDLGVFWILVVISMVVGVIDLGFFFFNWFVGMDWRFVFYCLNFVVVLKVFQCGAWGVLGYWWWMFSGDEGFPACAWGVLGYGLVGDFGSVEKISYIRNIL